MSQNLLKSKVAAWMAKAPLLAGIDAAQIASLMSAPPKRELGDIAFPLFTFSKAAKRSPMELATQLEAQISQLPKNPLIASVVSEGPYLNLTLKAGAAIADVLAEVARRSCGETPDTWHFGENDSGKGRTIGIDYSSPNIAKPLAVHHLRSTMIGNSLKKIYEANGWDVAGINHLGDWGTSFGKLIAGFAAARPEIANTIKCSIFEESNAEEVMKDLTVSDLNEIYVEFSRLAKDNPTLQQDGRREFQELESTMSGMTDSHTTSVITQSFTRGLRNFSIWEQIRRISLREFEVVYRMLGVKFQDFPLNSEELEERFTKDRSAFMRETGFYTGESYYVMSGSECRDVIARAKQMGLSTVSDGATVVYTDGEDKPPVMLLKDDGATSYHTRDAAAALYRHEKFGMSKALYVVGGEQRLHFTQLFGLLKMLGFDWASEFEHVDFGLVLGKDDETGKWGKFSTRAGRVVLLHDLLNEAIASVKTIIGEKNPELASKPSHLQAVAEAVGVGAVVFNDLKHGRRADVKFDWDEMLSFSGESGPYMLMQYVRLGSVMRRFEATHGALPKDFEAALLTMDHEKILALAVAEFPDIVAKAASENEPAVISRYLLELSSHFSSYWAASKESGIVSDDVALSSARISLVRALRKVLGKGLLLLGLRLVEEM